jgi:hypothetical protein
MKFGMRTPSLSKSIAARTSGKAKRSLKKMLIPGYGTKNSVLKLAHPVKSAKQSARNKIYRKTTFSIWDLFK